MPYKMYRIFQNIRNFFNIKVACVSSRYNVHYNRDLKEREKENMLIQLIVVSWLNVI